MIEVSTPFIFAGLFALGCIVLVFVYKSIIKEKSYEEAVAEQRQQTAALLGPNTKPKPKEKKSKKAAKKQASKEKQSTDSEAVDKETEVEESNSESSITKPHAHVEFKMEPEEVVKDAPKKKTTSNKKEKVRSILVNKEPEKVINDVADVIPSANHFEELHPKDDFELKAAIKEDAPLKDKATAVDGEVVPPKKKAKATKQPVVHAIATQATTTTVVVEKEKVEEKPVESSSHQTNGGGIMPNTGKEKKKKKSEFNTMQQLTAERDGLINLVRKAELTRSEVQILIDLLLNKQQDSPALNDDWSEGKFDPVQKLKKQLAEKEKAFADEHEALQGAQAKLREVRLEQVADRTQLQQKIKGIEELLQVKQLEVQGNAGRMQAMTQKMQQLQQQLNEEILRAHTLRDENNMQQIMIAKNQETENIIVKLGSDIQDLSTQNQHLRIELQRLNDADAEQKNSFFAQMSGMKQDLDQFKEMNRQLDDTNKDYERQLEKTMREEKDWKIENAQIKSLCQQKMEEVRRYEHETQQLQQELKQKSVLYGDAVKNIAQLKVELQNVQEDRISQINGSSEETKASKIEILNLTNELTSLKNELKQRNIVYNSELAAADKKALKLSNEIEEQKVKNNTLGEEVQAKERDQKEFLLRLFPEVEGLKQVSSSDWQSEYEQLIQGYVASIKEKKQVDLLQFKKLEEQIDHYKNAMDAHDRMLIDIQSRVEAEEINWRNKLKAKETELEQLNETHLSQLQQKVEALESELAEERSKNCSSSDETATIEKLTEQVDRLQDQLANKVGDCPKVQSCNSNGPSCTQLEQNSLSPSSSIASSLPEVTNNKPKNRKKKKKGNNNGN